MNCLSSIPGKQVAWGEQEMPECKYYMGSWGGS